jgi:hypothetical protein
MSRADAQPSPTAESEPEVARELERIYRSWSDVERDGGQEARSPGSRWQVRRSRRALRRLSPQDPALQERKELLEAAVETADARLRAFSAPLLFLGLAGTAAALLLLVALYATDPFARPDVDWDPADFTLVRPGTLLFDRGPEDAAAPIATPVRVPAGSRVEPLANAGEWVMVKLASGEIGWLHEEVFAGLERTEMREDTELYPGPRYKQGKKEPLARGARGRILKLAEHDIGTPMPLPVARVKFEDGREGWVSRWQCRTNFTVPLPSLNQTYYYVVDAPVLERFARGRTRQELSARFGPETGAWREKDGRWRSYFRGLIVVADGLHRQGVLVEYDEQGQAKAWQVRGKERTRAYEKLPLLAEVRALDPYRWFSSTYYSEGGRSWWDEFTERNLATRALGWVWAVLSTLAGIALLLTFPRILVGPALTLVSSVRQLPKVVVILLDGALLAFAYYLFFLLLVLVMDGIFTPLLLTAPAAFFWVGKHVASLNYHRCPNCGAMYTELAAGSRFVGRVEGTTTGTYRVDRGIREHQGERVHLIEIRDKQTVTTVDRFVDTQTCARCGCAWSINRDVLVDSQTSYH